MATFPRITPIAKFAKVTAISSPVSIVREFDIMHRTDLKKLIATRLAVPAAVKPLRVLDLGAGSQAGLLQALRQEFGSNLSLTAVDIVGRDMALPPAIEYIQNDGSVVFTRELKTRRFDMVVSHRAMMYFSDPIATIAHTIAKLDNNGWASLYIRDTYRATGYKPADIAEGFDTHIAPLSYELKHIPHAVAIDMTTLRPIEETEEIDITTEYEMASFDLYRIKAPAQIASIDVARILQREFPARKFGASSPIVEQKLRLPMTTMSRRDFVKYIGTFAAVMAANGLVIPKAMAQEKLSANFKLSEFGVPFVDMNLVNGLERVRTLIGNKPLAIDKARAFELNSPALFGRGAYISSKVVPVARLEGFAKQAGLLTKPVADRLFVAVLPTDTLEGIENLNAAQLANARIVLPAIVETMSRIDWDVNQDFLRNMAMLKMATASVESNFVETKLENGNVRGFFGIVPSSAQDAIRRVIGGQVKDKAGKIKIDAQRITPLHLRAQARLQAITGKSWPAIMQMSTADLKPFVRDNVEFGAIMSRMIYMDKGADAKVIPAIPAIAAIKQTLGAQAGSIAVYRELARHSYPAWHAYNGEAKNKNGREYAHLFETRFVQVMRYMDMDATVKTLQTKIEAAKKVGSSPISTVKFNFNTARLINAQSPKTISLPSINTMKAPSITRLSSVVAGNDMARISSPVMKLSLSVVFDMRQAQPVSLKTFGIAQELTLPQAVAMRAFANSRLDTLPVQRISVDEVERFVAMMRSPETIPAMKRLPANYRDAFESLRAQWDKDAFVDVHTNIAAGQTVRIALEGFGAELRIAPYKANDTIVLEAGKTLFALDVVSMPTGMFRLTKIHPNGLANGHALSFQVLTDLIRSIRPLYRDTGVMIGRNGKAEAGMLNAVSMISPEGNRVVSAKVIDEKLSRRHVVLQWDTYRERILRKKFVLTVTNLSKNGTVLGIGNGFDRTTSSPITANTFNTVRLINAQSPKTISLPGINTIKAPSITRLSPVVARNGMAKISSPIDFGRMFSFVTPIAAHLKGMISRIGSPAVVPAISEAEIRAFVEGVNPDVQRVLRQLTQRTSVRGEPIVQYPTVCSFAAPLAKELLLRKFGTAIKKIRIINADRNPSAIFRIDFHRRVEFETALGRNYYLSFVDGQFDAGFEGPKVQEYLVWDDFDSIAIPAFGTTPEYLQWYERGKHDRVELREITDERSHEFYLKHTLGLKTESDRTLKRSEISFMSAEIQEMVRAIEGGNQGTISLNGPRSSSPVYGLTTSVLRTAAQKQQRAAALKALNLEFGAKASMAAFERVERTISERLHQALLRHGWSDAVRSMPAEKFQLLANKLATQRYVNKAAVKLLDAIDLDVRGVANSLRFIERKGGVDYLEGISEQPILVGNRDITTFNVSGYWDNQALRLPHKVAFTLAGPLEGHSDFVRDLTTFAAPVRQEIRAALQHASATFERAVQWHLMQRFENTADFILYHGSRNRDFFSGRTMRVQDPTYFAFDAQRAASYALEGQVVKVRIPLTSIAEFDISSVDASLNEMVAKEGNYRILSIADARSLRISSPLHAAPLRLNNGARASSPVVIESMLPMMPEISRPLESALRDAKIRRVAIFNPANNDYGKELITSVIVNALTMHPQIRHITVVTHPNKKSIWSARSRAWTLSGNLQVYGINELDLTHPSDPVPLSYHYQKIADYLTAERFDLVIASGRQNDQFLRAMQMTKQPGVIFLHQKMIEIDDMPAQLPENTRFVLENPVVFFNGQQAFRVHNPRPYLNNMYRRQRQYAEIIGLLDRHEMIDEEFYLPTGIRDSSRVYVLFNPFSSRPAKDLDYRVLTNIMKRLLNERSPVDGRLYREKMVLLMDSGETEIKHAKAAELWNDLLRHVGDRIKIVHRSVQDLNGFNEFIGKADIIFTPDTYAMHAGIAARKWVIGTFGNAVEEVFFRWAPRTHTFMGLISQSTDVAHRRKPVIDENLMLRALTFTLDAAYEAKVSLPRMQRVIATGRAKPAVVEQETERIRHSMDYIFKDGLATRGKMAITAIMALQRKLFIAHREHSTMRLAAYDMRDMLKALDEFEGLLRDEYRPLGFHRFNDGRDLWRERIETLIGLRANGGLPQLLSILTGKLQPKRGKNVIAIAMAREYMMTSPAFRFIGLLDSHMNLLSGHEVSSPIKNRIDLRLPALNNIKRISSPALYVGTYQVKLNGDRIVLPKALIKHHGIKAGDRFNFRFDRRGLNAINVFEQAAWRAMKIAGKERYSVVEETQQGLELIIPGRFIARRALSNERHLTVTGAGRYFSIWRQEDWKRFEDRMMDKYYPWLKQASNESAMPKQGSSSPIKNAAVARIQPMNRMNFAHFALDNSKRISSPITPVAMEGRLNFVVTATEDLVNIAQYIEHMQKETGRRILTIFGSARKLPSDQFQRIRQIARRAAEAGFIIVTGGGPGAMEAANRGAIEGKGLSIGIRIELPFEQGFNDNVNFGWKFSKFFIRLLALEVADAFVVAEGGFGTLHELSDTATLIKQNLISADVPVILLGKKYYTGFMTMARMAYSGLEIGNRTIQITKTNPEDVIVLTNNINDIMRRIKAAPMRKRVSIDVNTTVAHLDRAIQEVLWATNGNAIAFFGTASDAFGGWQEGPRRTQPWPWYQTTRDLMKAALAKDISVLVRGDRVSGMVRTAYEAYHSLKAAGVQFKATPVQFMIAGGKDRPNNHTTVEGIQYNFAQFRFPHLFL
ncbi:MAG: LOG family protein, partial [Candidatus Omnitrophota bacterium]